MVKIIVTGIIALYNHRIHRQPVKQSAASKNPKKIKNVGAHNVAQGNFVRPGKRSRSAHRKLRHTGTTGHNRESNNQGGHLKNPRQRRASIHKNVRPLHQRHKPRNQNHNVQKYHFITPTRVKH